MMRLHSPKNQAKPSVHETPGPGRSFATGLFCARDLRWAPDAGDGCAPKEREVQNLGTDQRQAGPGLDALYARVLQRWETGPTAPPHGQRAG